MIAKMKKITLFCAAGDVNHTLHKLRNLGAVHIKNINPPRSEDIDKARETLKYVQRALNVLPKHPHMQPSGKSGERVIKDVWNLIQDREQLEENLEDMRHEQGHIRPFGNFDPRSVQDLEQKGWQVRLYKTGPKKERPKTPAGGFLRELERNKNGIYYALVARDASELDAQQVRHPKLSLKEIETKIEALETDLERNALDLKSHAGDRSAVEEIVTRVRERVVYLETLHSMGNEEPIAYLKGYLPADSEKKIRDSAAENGWGYRIEEPSGEDKPPTLIRNPHWVRIIRPIFDFMGILPGYNEVDISFFFLIFLSIFFGMIVGDAGYGVLFLTATLLLRKRMRKFSSLMTPLLAVMSVSAIIWGALQGQYFAMNATPAIFQSLKLGWLSSNEHLMYLCFLIGTVHLTIAHGWNVIRYINTLQALAQVGWICTTWFMFFVVRSMVLDASWSPYYFILLGVGATLIALFMTPWKRLKSEWFNHVMLPLDLISNFVDVVSYVRLFAVGLATFAVGNAFNNMSLGGGIDSVLSGLAAALILFLGHSLNIIMSIMSVLVHGIRLNTLEFSGHLGMRWSGEKFTPFATATKQSEAHKAVDLKETSS